MSLIHKHYRVCYVKTLSVLLVYPGKAIFYPGNENNPPLPVCKN